MLSDFYRRRRRWDRWVWCRLGRRLRASRHPHRPGSAHPRMPPPSALSQHPQCPAYPAAVAGDYDHAENDTRWPSKSLRRYDTLGALVANPGGSGLYVILTDSKGCTVQPAPVRQACPDQRRPSRLIRRWKPWPIAELGNLGRGSMLTKLHAAAQAAPLGALPCWPGGANRRCCTAGGERGRHRRLLRPVQSRWRRVNSGWRCSCRCVGGCICTEGGASLRTGRQEPAAGWRDGNRRAVRARRSGVLPGPRRW